MASNTKVPGIEVAILFEGRPLIEYDDLYKEEVSKDENKGEVFNLDADAAQHQASRTVTKYIESVSDMEFAIKLSVNSPYEFDVGCDLLCFDIYVDGRKVRAPLLFKTNYTSKNGWSQVINGVRKEKGFNSMTQKFKFASIKTSESHEPRIRQQAYHE
jgi:hypothetical protein